MKLTRMIMLVFVYLIVTGFFSKLITGGGIPALMLWFGFAAFWNILVRIKIIPSVKDPQP